MAVFLNGAMRSYFDAAVLGSNSRGIGLLSRREPDRCLDAVDAAIAASFERLADV